MKKIFLHIPNAEHSILKTLVRFFIVSTSDEPVISLGQSQLDVQSISQSNPMTTSTISSMVTLPPSTSIASNIVAQQAEGITDYILPRPKDLAATRVKKTIVNKSRAARKTT